MQKYLLKEQVKNFIKMKQKKKKVLFLKKQKICECELSSYLSSFLHQINSFVNFFPPFLFTLFIPFSNSLSTFFFLSVFSSLKNPFHTHSQRREMYDNLSEKGFTSIAGMKKKKSSFFSFNFLQPSALLLLAVVSDECHSYHRCKKEAA